MRVPDFLVRQFYVTGSLQPEGDGFRLQARTAWATARSWASAR